MNCKNRECRMPGASISHLKVLNIRSSLEIKSEEPQMDRESAARYLGDISEKLYTSNVQPTLLQNSP